MAKEIKETSEELIKEYPIMEYSVMSEKINNIQNCILDQLKEGLDNKVNLAHCIDLSIIFKNLCQN